MKSKNPSETPVALSESPLRYMAEISFRLDQTAFNPHERAAIDRQLQQLDVRALRATSSFLQRLNAEQAEALLHPHDVSGPLLILAGAGSGKTTVLTRRIAYLLACGVPEQSIFAVTFTRKAAGEMAERLEKLLSSEMPSRFFNVEELWISTFHSACTRILRDSVGGVPNIVRLGYKHQKFTAVDERTQIRVMQQVLAGIPGSRESYTAEQALELISDAKQKLLDPHKFAASGEDPDPAHRLTIAYRDYQKALVARNMLDFDDMILLTVHLLDIDPEVRAHYQQAFKYLLIDEYQDTNMAQYRLASLLVGDKNELFVVGDDDQSIYGFRGADIRNILEFRKDFPRAKIVKLEANYRSSATIIAAANNVFDKKDKTLQKTLRVGRKDAGDGNQGEPILRHAAQDERDEAEFVAEEIQVERGKGKPLNNFAVLYRVNAQAEPFCNVFESYGIPYQVAGGRVIDHEVIQDVVALLKLVDFELRFRAKDLDRRRVQEAHTLYLRLLLVQDTRFRFDTKTFQMVQHWYSDKEWRCPACLGFLRKDVLRCNHCQESIEGPFPGMSSYEALVHYQERYPDYRRRFERQGTWEHMERLLGIIGQLASVADRYDIGELVEIALSEWGLRTNLRVALDAEARERNKKIENFVELAFDFDENFSEELETRAYGKLRSFLNKLLDSSEEDRVTLSTLHAAKGLEWPTVFYVGLEDGLSPHAPRGRHGRVLSLEDVRSQAEEEERLFYVGITRARDVLYLTHAAERKLYTRHAKNPPSPFLGRVPKDLLQRKSRSGARQGALRAGLQRTAALLDERHKRRRILQILQQDRTEKRHEAVALSIEPRPLPPEVTDPTVCILANPDLYGMVAVAQALRVFPKADLRFVYPNHLASALADAAGRADAMRSLFVLGLPMDEEQLDLAEALLSSLEDRGVALRWYDHHPWSERALAAVASISADFVVNTEVDSVAQILALRLFPGDEMADRLARLLADRLSPAEEQWGLDWSCLLEELSGSKNLARRRAVLEKLAQDQPLGSRERIDIRRNIARRFLTDEIARLAHRAEFTAAGRKFLVIDLRRVHRETSALGQRQYVVLYRRPNAVPLGLQACRQHEADFALLVHDAERFSLHRFHHESGVDLERLLDLTVLDGVPIRVEGHDYAVGVRVRLSALQRWSSRLSFRLPFAAEALIAEVRARL